MPTSVSLAPPVLHRIMDSAKTSAQEAAGASVPAGSIKEPDLHAVQASTSAPAAFKPKRNRGNIRKRADEGDDLAAAGSAAAGDDDGGAAVHKAKQAKVSTLAFSTKKDEEKLQSTVIYESSRAIQSGRDDTATRANETETAFDRDARASREQVLRQAGPDGLPADDGTYKGMNNYIDYRQAFRREHTIGAEKGSGAHGPLRGSSYVRTTARIDYQPDVCKDYKETGFCSYGDSCKFMHDRGDYKSGWELEKMWEEEQKAKRKALLEGWDPDKEVDEEGAAAGAVVDDELPFACYICRRPWEECKDPVVTKCKHYFCESCALKHNSKTGKCAACDQPTQGIFNVATDIQKKMKRLAAKVD